MKKIIYAIRVLRHSPWSTLVKVVSLGLGMAMCVFLLDMFLYIVNYDKCYRDSDEIQQIWMQFTYNSTGNTKPPQQQCYGPVAGIIYEHFPEQVEEATSIWSTNPSIEYKGTQYWPGTTVCADSLFFDTMGIQVLRGNPRKDLVTQDVVYLSKSTAETIFGSEDPIGKTVKALNMDATVRGIFEDVPQNASVRPAAVASMPTIINRQWLYYGLNGGDSFYEYLRLRKGTDLDEFNREVAKMWKDICPPGDVTVDLLVRPLTETSRGNDSHRTILAIAVILGLSLILVTALNYVLISIASLSYRAKAIGVHKCSGASPATIAVMFLVETGIVLAMSAVVAAVTLYYTREYMDSIAGINVAWILDKYKWSIVAVFGLLFLIGGLIPARMFSRIPVTQVFRRFSERNAAWKRALLFIQFGGIAFVASLLCAVSVQYSFVLGHSVGYDTVHTAFGYSLVPGNRDQSPALISYMKGLPYVEDVSAAWSIPPWGYSGEYIRDGRGNVLFSTRLNSSTENYIKAQGMELLKGRAQKADDEAVVNEEFCRLMHWNPDSIFATPDPVVVNLNGDRMKVVGLVKDFVIGDYMSEPKPYLSTYMPSVENNVNYLLVRVKEPAKANIAKLNEDMTKAFSGAKSHFDIVSEVVADKYATVRFFRTIILLTSAIIAFIVLMGLIGFVRDEIQRRSKEIAIRKVNGAEASDIIRLICTDVMKVAAPAVVIGIAGAWYIGRMWFEQFYIVVDYLPVYYVLAGLGILALILICVALLARRTALDNPVNSIKSE